MLNSLPIMRKCFTLCTTIFCISFSNFSLAETTEEVVSKIINSVESQFEDESAAIDSLKDLAWQYRFDKSEEALLLINYCYEYDVKTGDPDRFLDALHVKSTILEKMYRIIQAKEVCELGIQQAKKINNQHKLKLFYSTYSSLLSDISVDSAFFYAQNAMMISFNLKDTSALTANLNHLASLYGKIEEHEASLEYLKQALHLAEELDYTVAIAGSHNNLANCFKNLNMLDSALYHYGISLNIKRELNDSYGIAGTLNNIGLMYSNRNDFLKAQKCFEEALSVFKEIKSVGKTADVLINLSRNYSLQNEYHKGLNCALEALNILEDAKLDNNQSTNIELYLQLYTAYFALGDSKNALEALQQYVEAKDFLSSEKYKAELSKNQVRFEISLKNEIIKSLRNNAKLNVQVLRRKEKYQNLLIFSIFLVVVIALLLYLAYRMKGRSAKEMNESNQRLNVMIQEKRDLLDEVNHRVKNNLQMISSFLEMQSFKTNDEEFKNLLSQSVSRIHAIGVIHEVTQENDAVQYISTYKYLVKLLDKLVESSMGFGQVTVDQDIEDFTIRTNQAVSIGLILNELVTNSFKYAFFESSDPNISVKFKKDNEDLVLVVSDNGCGFKYDNPNVGMGLKLVNAFVSKMKGKLMHKSALGTTYEILIPLET